MINIKSIKRTILGLTLALVLISCQLLGPAQVSEEALSESVAQTVAALLAAEGEEIQPLATPTPTPTMGVGMQTEETPVPEADHDPYGPARFITEVDVGVEFDAINCGGFTGQYVAVLTRSLLGTSCSGVDDACGYRFAPVEPFTAGTINLPERSGSGACEGEIECDWYSEPFDFSYTFVRRAYDCECDGITRLAAVETWSFEYINARMVIHSYVPGEIAHATIMAEEVIHNVTHSSPDVPDVVDVARQGVETEIFEILYGAEEDRCTDIAWDELDDDLPELVPIVPGD